MWSNILSILIEAMIAALGAIFAKYLIPLIKDKIQNTWIEKAVRAAEKIYKESGTGEQKKQYVINFLVSKGIVVKDENGNIPQTIDVLIEAAVKELDALIPNQ